MSNLPQKYKDANSGEGDKSLLLLQKDGWVQLPSYFSLERFQKNKDKITNITSQLPESLYKEYACDSRFTKDGILGFVNPLTFFYFVTTSNFVKSKYNGLINLCTSTELKDTESKFNLENSDKKFQIGTVDYNFNNQSFSLSGLINQGSSHNVIALDKEYFIRKIVDYLKTPDYIGGEFEFNDFNLDTKYYDAFYKDMFDGFFNSVLYDKYISKTIKLFWNKEDVQLDVIFNEQSYPMFNLMFYDNKLLDKALNGCCYQSLKNKEIFGKIKPNFKLQDFHSEAKDLHKIIHSELNSNPIRYNVLVQGKPDTGKTEFIKSICVEELVPRGFVIFHFSYHTLKLMHQIPHAIKKVAIMVNEVDNLVPNRDAMTNIGDSEQYLEFFDGNCDCVEPFYEINSNKDKDDRQIIILMTANTTERLDTAFLTDKRVHTRYTFTHSYS